MIAYTKTLSRLYEDLHHEKEMHFPVTFLFRFLNFLRPSPEVEGNMKVRGCFVKPCPVDCEVRLSVIYTRPNQQDLLKKSMMTRNRAGEKLMISLHGHS